MPVIVNIHAAKTQLSKLVDRANRGEEIVLAKNGKAHARLVPLEPQELSPRQLGFLKIKFSQKSNKALQTPLSKDEVDLWE